MAVLMLNVCKFKGCDLTFNKLIDLIQHIEETHIDFNPQVMQQTEKEQPASVPLSYVLRFFTDAAQKELLEVKKTSSAPVYNSSQNTTPSASEGDEDETMTWTEDSEDSWAINEDLNSEYVFRQESIFPKKINLTKKCDTWSIDGNYYQNISKPFACPVPGCKKRYKNINGIKYHTKNGHKNDEKLKKGYKCHCGKNYKTSQGLKNHSAAMHSGVNMALFNMGEGEYIQFPMNEALFSFQPSNILALPSTAQYAPMVGDPLDCTLGVLTPATSPINPYYSSSAEKYKTTNDFSHH